MKIAIHYDKDNFSFSTRWIDYCERNHISYKVVNCYTNDILNDINDCDGLMWHWYQGDYRGMLFARQLIFSLEEAGKKVFPSSSTCWHFDDKIGQKYLLEALEAPRLPSYVFYEKEEALKWLDTILFPVVFKLRGGAGSTNVKLVRNKREGVRLVEKSFGKGFPFLDNWALLKDKIAIARREKDARSLITTVKQFVRCFFPTRFEKLQTRQKGYIYFQKFLPNNEYDTRIIVIGNRAFGLIRYNREGDFRASGSGNFEYRRELFDERAVKIAFEISRKLKAQSTAYDFIMDEQHHPVIVEISYGFSIGAYDSCPGYWDADLNWHEGFFNAQYFMVEDFLNEIKHN